MSAFGGVCASAGGHVDSAAGCEASPGRATPATLLKQLFLTSKSDRWTCFYNPLSFLLGLKVLFFQEGNVRRDASGGEGEWLCGQAGGG